MKSQRRFAPKGGRIESESVAELAGISSKYNSHRLRNFFLTIDGDI